MWAVSPSINTQRAILRSAARERREFAKMSWHSSRREWQQQVSRKRASWLWRAVVAVVSVLAFALVAWALTALAMVVLGQ